MHFIVFITKRAMDEDQEFSDKKIQPSNSRRTRSLGTVEAHRPLKGKMPIKLSRSLHVVSSLDFSSPQIDELIIEKEVTAVCMSPSYLLVVSSLFLLIALLLVVFVYLYICQRRRKQETY